MKQKRSKLKALAVMPEKITCGAGLARTSLWLLATSIKQIARRLRIGGGIDRHADLNAAAAIGADIILDDAGDEIGIRHDHRGAVEGRDFGRPHIDAADDAFLIADDDPIADADRPLPEKNESRDEIIDDRLQAEADADRERAGDDREFFEAQAQIGAGKASAMMKPT